MFFFYPFLICYHLISCSLFVLQSEIKDKRKALNFGELASHGTVATYGEGRGGA